MFTAISWAHKRPSRNIYWIKEGKEDLLGCYIGSSMKIVINCFLTNVKCVWFLICRQRSLTGIQRRWALSMDLFSGVTLWHKFQVVSFQTSLLLTGKINWCNCIDHLSVTLCFSRICKIGSQFGDAKWKTGAIAIDVIHRYWSHVILFLRVPFYLLFLSDLIYLAIR